MTAHQQTNDEAGALWGALEAMRIEADGAKLSFAARLARENGWSPAFAEAALTEYRRFLYLAAVSDRPVTPSEAVDQAWHLHLSYTRHYWDVLCGEMLGRPLHHEPTAGGRDEAARHRGQYEATLWLYRETFGAAPPVEIWPDTGARFAARPQWVDRARYWLVPKLWVGSGAALATATVLLAACTMLGANSAGRGAVNAFGAIMLSLGIGAAVVALIVAAVRGSRRKDDGSGGGCGGGGCSGGGDSCGCGSGCGGGCGGD